MDNSTGTALFRELANDGEELGDTNFCTVIATAVVFGKTFEQANKLLIKHANRRKRRGLQRHKSLSAWSYLAKQENYDYRVYTAREIKEKFTNGKTLTTGNSSKYLNPKKRYIISVRQHVAGVVDNTVHDWTNGKANRAQQLIEFTPRETVKLIPETSDVSGYNEWNNRLAKMLTA